MSKRIALFCAIFLVALFVIDRASMFAPPCFPFRFHVLDSSKQNYDNRSNQEYCAEREGIIVAGLSVIYDAKPEVWTALATIGIAFFTYFLKRSTDKMWSASENQIQEMRNIAAIQARQMRASIREATKSAQTALDQTELAKIGIFDLERAYLSVGLTEINTEFVPHRLAYYEQTDPKRTTLKFYVHNTGRTGALIKVLYGEFSRTPPQGGTPVYKNGTRKETDFSIAGGAESAITPYVFVDDYTDKQFFWGYIEYVDIFKRRHIARVCASILPAQMARPGTGKFDIAGSEGWRECD
jgi:hypothetical protein